MKNTKNKTNLKILILTQIHPVNISYVYDEICHRFLDYNEVFSPQIMAILGELSLKENSDDFKHSYRVLNAAFVKNIKAAVQKMNPLKPWIFVGNCDKDSIKFDYVIGFNGGEDFGNDNDFDFYIREDHKALTDANLAINYYTKEDAEIFLPTINHLMLFLDTLKLERNNNAGSTK